MGKFNQGDEIWIQGRVEQCLDDERILVAVGENESMRGFVVILECASSHIRRLPPNRGLYPLGGD